MPEPVLEGRTGPAGRLFNRPRLTFTARTTSGSLSRLPRQSSPLSAHFVAGFDAPLCIVMIAIGERG